MGFWNRFNIRLASKRIQIVDRTIVRHVHLRDNVGVAYLQLKKHQLEAEVDRRNHREAAEFCRRHGCDMQHMGGANCGCIHSFGDAGAMFGDCSIPVMKCVRCGDCDYGENEEADQIRRHCAEGSPPVHGQVMRRSA